MVKKVVCIIFGLLLNAQIAIAAPWLACNPPTETVTICEVEVSHNGETTTVPGTVTLSTDGAHALLLDLGGFANGNYTFRARWASVPSNGEPWWSEWSEPFSIVKAGNPGNVIIKMK